MTTQDNNTPATDSAAARVAILIKRTDAEIARQQLVVTHLVESIARDATDLQKTVKGAGSERVYPTWIEMHVRELVAACEAIEKQREFQRTLQSLVGE